MTQDTRPESAAASTTGRNEPCPCGSGKKYKRCCGVDAAPKLSTPKASAQPSATLGGGIPGMPAMDPSQMDPAQLKAMSAALKRLPKAQLAKLQSVMFKAMRGKDVTEEAAELERLLPPEFQQMMAQAAGQSLQPAPESSTEVADAEMSAEDARKIVEEAARSGKISRTEAEKILGESLPAEEKKGFWKKLLKK